VTRHSPEDRDFSGTTLEDGLAWCLVWLLAPELGVGPFLVGNDSIPLDSARNRCGPEPKPVADGVRRCSRSRHDADELYKGRLDVNVGLF
jgi:hypothetical protein